ncbi:MAG: glycosyltransferase family 4 protein [bacterium]
MKIGFDAKRAFCNGTGLGNYSRAVIRGVKEVERVLYTPKVKARFEHCFDDLRVVRPKGLWRLAPGLWRSVGVRWQAKRDGVELFHGLSHELPYGLPKGMKQVVTMHDLIVFRFPEFFKPADRVIHKVKMRHACRVADVVVAISEQTKRDLMELMGVDEKKIKVVYQSCDPIFWGVKGTNAEVRNRYNLPEKYIICVGTVEERKNQIAAVRAVAELPEEVKFVIVGRPRGGYPARVHEVVQECGMEHRTLFLEKADFVDFPALYGGAVASVYMSRFEGFGIPVLESLCCDTPVVTSNVSSMPEAGGEAALYAAPDDYHTVAAHLRRLMEDDRYRCEVIEKGRTQRMKFAPEKVVQDMLAVYSSIVS